MRYGFHDISGHQHLEAKQERATDAKLVDLRCRSWRQVDQAMPVTMMRTPKISIPLSTSLSRST